METKNGWTHLYRNCYSFVICGHQFPGSVPTCGFDGVPTCYGARSDNSSKVGLDSWVD